MTNKMHTVLYVGVTNDLLRRVWEHQNGHGSRFTNRYLIHKLVYYEETQGVEAAIAREKQHKGGSREKKLRAIESMNPGWKDLAEDLV